MMEWENISDIAIHYGQERPNAIAVVCGGEALTYGELAVSVRRTAIYLRSLGIGPDDRVGVSLTNHIDHLILSLALMRVGAVIFWLTEGMPAQKRTEIVLKYAIRTVFVEATAAPVKAARVIRVDVAWRGRVPAAEGDARCEKTGDELSLVILSSGSTGVPKAIVSSQRQRLARSRVHVDLLREHAPPDDPGTLIVTASLSWGFFNQCLITQLMLGGTLVMLPKYLHPTDAIRAIASYDKVTLPVTTNMAREFLECADRPGVLLPEVRALIVSGLPLFPSEKRALAERITPNVFEFYGTAGFGTIACLSPADIPTNTESVGRIVVPGTVEIVDEAGHEVAPGQIGMVRCRGDSVANGFLGEKENPGPERFADGWYYPGDMVAIDENGWVYLKGRKADIIYFKGQPVFPTEIEKKLASHPAIYEVVVVGTPSSSGYGEQAVACVVLKNEQQRREVIAFCQKAFDKDKLLAGVYFLNQTPVTGNGKTDRLAVKHLVLQWLSQQPGAAPLSR